MVLNHAGTTLSVVIPAYNEAAALPALAGRLRPVLDRLAEPYEVLIVDDGSTDTTASVLAGLGESWPELRIVRLRRNSGHQGALIAGLFRALGDYVVSIDADLQDPPEKIPEMLQLARRDGLDIVHGVREDRSSDTPFKRWSASVYYRLMRRLVGAAVPAHAGDFRLLSRSAIEVLRGIPGRHVLRLLVPWTGLPAGEVRYARQKRVAGGTKYPLSKMVLLATESVTAFSAAPLRIATGLGLVGVTVAIGLSLMASVRYLNGDTVSGWTSIFMAVLFFGAVQLLCLGLLGEYIGRLFATVQGLPRYLVGSDTADAATVPDPAGRQ